MSGLRLLDDLAHSSFIIRTFDVSWYEVPAVVEAREDEGLLSHEKEEEKRRLKNRNTFFDIWLLASSAR